MSDLRAGVRSLLASPLLDGSSPAGLAEVRRHRSDLARFFGEELGYHLDASRSGVVRLAKMPSPAHVTRGLTGRNGRRFDGRRYAVTCLVLAAVESAGERTTLARLFEEVASRAAGIPDLSFDVDVAADRRLFVHAVQAAVDLGVLELAEGDEERFARGSEGGDALYRVDRERLALLPTAPMPPSLVAVPEDLAQEAYPDTEDGRVRRRRHRVMRCLVEEPVTYTTDLSADELDYIRSQRPRIERILTEHVGLSLEVRAEGWVTVDDSGELTDLSWPDFGTANTVALRICDELGRRRRQAAPEPWARDAVISFVASLAAEYTGYWRKGADTEGQAGRLADEALDILETARLAARVDGGVVPLAAAGRFAAKEAMRSEGRGQIALTEGEEPT